MLKKLFLILFMVVIMHVTTININALNNLKFNRYYKFSEIETDDYIMQFQFNSITKELRIIYRESDYKTYDEGRIRNTVYKHVKQWMIGHKPKFYHYRTTKYEVSYNKEFNGSIVNQVLMEFIIK